jgi:hypothetical protein
MYRSRLEARWAAFFYLVDWKYEYEPYDLQGWIPDFIISNNTEHGLLVEIKPTLLVSGFDKNKIANAIKNTKEGTEVLLLGCNIQKQNSYFETKIGWLHSKEFPDDAILNKYHDQYGIIGDCGSWADRITGLYNGDGYVSMRVNA